MITVPGVLTRFLLGGGAVAISAVVANLAGGRIGGIFAAFPAVYLSAVIVAVYGLSAPEAVYRVVQISHGALIGMLANVVCAACASVFIRRRDLMNGLGLAILVWFIVSGFVFFASLAAGLIK